ncbi:hypothetical protein EV203_11368 [Caldanaerobacter subterraneus]|uniref:Uncharacterized protein n=1 Tax=Caldanaerobacter subterraneus TaxID=911092 RepID=A0A4R2K2H1_9THEO|nr:hypothetical protein EV203_11368 [Caldanaerobacter subterraneus]
MDAKKRPHREKIKNQIQRKKKSDMLLDIRQIIDIILLESSKFNSN